MPIVLPVSLECLGLITLVRPFPEVQKLDEGQILDQESWVKCEEPGPAKSGTLA